MARLYVGQRVKMARPRNPIFFGMTGLIREFIEPLHDGADCLVDWDCGSRDGLQSLGFNGYATFSHQLEPIIDTGREVIAWSECVWKPEHLRTEA